MRNEKIIRTVFVFLFMLIFTYLLFLLHFGFFSKILEIVVSMSVFLYVFLLLYTRNIFEIIGKEVLYLKNVKIIGIIRVLIACIFIVIFFMSFYFS